MNSLDDITYIGTLLDRFAEKVYCHDCAAEDPEDYGVPLEMQDGDIDAEGWVAWKILPSSLVESDIAGLEAEFSVQFPALFRTYLLSRFHLFDQVHSAKHDQLIMLVSTPSSNPLRAVRKILGGWQPLIAAGYIPFSEWGDGWGPICFKINPQNPDETPAVIWFDHDQLNSLTAAQIALREILEQFEKPIYDSFREMLEDVFGES
jgi:hypothetical protein